MKRHLVLALLAGSLQGAEPTTAFFDAHCIDCHDADTHKGNLDLSALKQDFGDAENFAKWVKVHDIIDPAKCRRRKRNARLRQMSRR